MKLILLSIVLIYFGSKTAYAYSDFLICVRILQSNSLPDRETIAACQNMKRSSNFSKFPICVMDLTRLTDFSVVQSVDFCIEINAEEVTKNCVLKKNKYEFPKIEDAIVACRSQ